MCTLTLWQAHIKIRFLVCKLCDFLSLYEKDLCVQFLICMNVSFFFAATVPYCICYINSFPSYGYGRRKNVYIKNMFSPLLYIGMQNVYTRVYHSLWEYVLLNRLLYALVKRSKYKINFRHEVWLVRKTHTGYPFSIPYWVRGYCCFWNICTVHYCCTYLLHIVAISWLTVSLQACDFVCRLEIYYETWFVTLLSSNCVVLTCVIYWIDPQKSVTCRFTFTNTVCV